MGKKTKGTHQPKETERVQLQRYAAVIAELLEQAAAKILLLRARALRTKPSAGDRLLREYATYLVDHCAQSNVKGEALLWRGHSQIADRTLARWLAERAAPIYFAVPRPTRRRRVSL